mmetsp:Transcript_20943/g.44451  ORF Transcript_20943/g.44451 Transcript_20943/m.44451 type:complete len:420 (-) Transcript_20943:163-1422(-)
MHSYLLFTVSNVLVLWHCFVRSKGASVSVQAVGNGNNNHDKKHGILRRHLDSPPSTRFRNESFTNDYISRKKGIGSRRNPIRKSNNEEWNNDNNNQDAAPSESPISAPTAAPMGAPSSFLNTQNDNDEHNAWLLQEQQQQQYQIESTTFPASSPISRSATGRRRKSKGILPSFVSTQNFSAATRSCFTAVRSYSHRVYSESSTTFWVASSSIVVFVLWNLLPPARPILTQYFLASRRSAKWTFGLSLIFSAVSHTSFRHLVINIYVFLNLSPAISSIKVPSSSWASKTRRPYAGLSDAALWPFLLGGALAGNLLFLLFRPRGSCLGLSGVTCAMLAAYASAMPNRVLRIMLMGIIPVSLRAGTMVQVFLVVSLAGSVFVPSSPVSHLAHLGGLLFGLLYYQNVMIKSNQKLPMTLLFGR